MKTDFINNERLANFFAVDLSLSRELSWHQYCEGCGTKHFVLWCCICLYFYENSQIFSLNLTDYSFEGSHFKTALLNTKKHQLKSPLTLGLIFWIFWAKFTSLSLLFSFLGSGGPSYLHQISLGYLILEGIHVFLFCFLKYYKSISFLCLFYLYNYTYISFNAQ